MVFIEKNEVKIKFNISIMILDVHHRGSMKCLHGMGVLMSVETGEGLVGEVLSKECLD